MSNSAHRCILKLVERYSGPPGALFCSGKEITMNKQWVRWVDRTTGGSSSRRIAQKIDRSASTVSRWMRDGVPAEAPVEIALAYRGDIIAGLVAAGIIPESKRPVNLCEALRMQPLSVLEAELERRNSSR